MIHARTIAALALTLATAAAQSFEVATVKVNWQPLPVPSGGNPNLPPPPPPPPSVRPSPTGVTISGVSLKYCLQWAYNLKSWQITGPDWMGTERYDIAAKTSAPVTVDQLKPMLRQLLTERFRMSLHRETKEARVMAIVRTPGELRLKPSAPGATFDIQAIPIGNGGVRFTYTHAGIAVLEGLFSLPFGLPVLDMTGVTGTFDFSFDRPGHDSDNTDAWSGDLRLAIEKQLGLRLEPRRAQIEYLVIERAEKLPVEN